MIGAVLYAQRLERLVAFYRALGFEVVESDPGDHAVLELSGSQLVIVQIPERIAKDIDIATPPAVRANTPVKLAFVVPSIDAALTAGSALGGLQEQGGTWEFRGHSVRDAIDPEGNVFQLREANPASG